MGGGEGRWMVGWGGCAGGWEGGVGAWVGGREEVFVPARPSCLVRLRVGPKESKREVQRRAQDKGVGRTPTVITLNTNVEAHLSSLLHPHVEVADSVDGLGLLHAADTNDYQQT